MKEKKPPKQTDSDMAEKTRRDQAKKERRAAAVAKR